MNNLNEELKNAVAKPIQASQYHQKQPETPTEAIRITATSKMPPWKWCDTHEMKAEENQEKYEKPKTYRSQEAQKSTVQSRR